MLIFEIEQKPVYKIVSVHGVRIPVMGEFTVAETIAIEKAEIALGENPTTTEKLRAWLAAWLVMRLDLTDAQTDYKTAEQNIVAQLNKSTALIDDLWEVYKGERFGLITVDDDDDTVTEGKDGGEQLSILIESGMASTSNSHQVALLQNSEMDLDSNE
jgi:hypothetical protein